MTLIEFLAPLRKDSTRRDLCLSVLYYYATKESVPALTVSEIRSALVRARVPRSSSINISDVMNRSGHYTDSTTTARDGKRGWALTNAGMTYVQTLLGLPTDKSEVLRDSDTLTRLAATLPDNVVRGYVEEAIKCLQAGALRAAVVFLWSGAIRTIQDEMLSVGSTSLNQAIQKHDPKAKQVQRIEDFAVIKDSTSLLAARELGLIDKGQWQTLVEALNLRNRCGHPTKYIPGVKKASSLIEDLVGIAF